MDQTPRKQTLPELQDFIAKASPDEIKYLLDRYSGPHNIVLREKMFTYEAAKQIQYMSKMALADILLEQILSE